jgi:hypothetical protein
MLLFAAARPAANAAHARRRRSSRCKSLTVSTGITSPTGSDAVTFSVPKLNGFSSPFMAMTWSVARSEKVSTDPRTVMAECACFDSIVATPDSIVISWPSDGTGRSKNCAAVAGVANRSVTRTMCF